MTAPCIDRDDLTRIAGTRAAAATISIEQAISEGGGRVGCALSAHIRDAIETAIILAIRDAIFSS